MTDPEDRYTLEEAKRVLARRECEEDMVGRRIFKEWETVYTEEVPNRKVSPLGHWLEKRFRFFGEEARLDHYACLRCGAKFVEVSQDVVP